MSRKRKILPVFENVEILDTGSEGKAIARVDNRVIFVPFAVPGDICDIRVTNKKKSYMLGRIEKLRKASELRTEPRCKHFGLCGGCKWQNMQYRHQLRFKQKQVEDNFRRIGKLNFPSIRPILASPDIFHYRNKMEFTFSNRKWITDTSGGRLSEDEMKGLGFHLPGMFSRILDLDECFLQDNPSNAIRLAIKEYAVKNKLSFYNVLDWTGFLRNLIIRNTSTGALMLIISVNEDREEDLFPMLDFIKGHFPEITSMHYVINTKKNPDLSDQKIILYHGASYIRETMEHLTFRIAPKSFFQTNYKQALRMYQLTSEFASLKGNETVYDLYTGTGTIANFIAGKASRVVGIEYLEDAVRDARENSKLNGITNTEFFAGDMSKILTMDFIKQHGRPDIVITDPPRAGMSPDVIHQLLLAAPEKIAYISCNPATQARDLALLSECYEIKEVQPIDMFPHTQHVENMAMLVRK